MHRRILYGLGAAVVGLSLWFGAGFFGLFSVLALPTFFLFVAATVRPSFFERERFAALYAVASAVVVVGAVGWAVGRLILASPAPLYLLPPGYTGPALVVYSQQDGEPERYEDGRRVYAIPDSGILRTRFGRGEGVYAGRSAFAYVDDRGRRKAIPYVDWPHQPRESAPDTFASNLQFSSGAVTYTCDAPPGGSGGESVRYALFHVSPYQDSTGRRLRELEAMLPPAPKRRPEGCP